MVLNPETSHVSPQFHVVVDDEFSTVTVMREGTITPNWTDLVQYRSQIGAMENIDHKDNWFTQYLEEDPRKTPRQDLSITSDNNNQLQSKPHVQ